MIKSVKDRLLSKIQVSSSGCWIWVGAKSSRGYGAISLSGKMVQAHRASYSVFNGEIPGGMCVCHTCDTPACINPKHLFLGTHKENMADAVSKGRIHKPKDQQGSGNNNAKYSMEFAESVRRYYEENKPSFSKLASRFGIKSKGHAAMIVKNEIWKRQ